jgi:hypothetical protein
VPASREDRRDGSGSHGLRQRPSGILSVGAMRQSCVWPVPRLTTTGVTRTLAWGRRRSRWLRDLLRRAATLVLRDSERGIGSPARKRSLSPRGHPGASVALSRADSQEVYLPAPCPLCVSTDHPICTVVPTRGDSHQIKPNPMSSVAFGRGRAIRRSAKGCSIVNSLSDVSAGWLSVLRER